VDEDWKVPDAQASQLPAASGDAPPPYAPTSDPPAEDARNAASAASSAVSAASTSAKDLAAARAARAVSALRALRPSAPPDASAAVATRFHVASGGVVGREGAFGETERGAHGAG
jgi:hypothetical protein